MKKLLLLLGLVTCLFSFTACGSSMDVIEGTPLAEEEEAGWISSAEQLVSYMVQIEQSGQAEQLDNDPVFSAAMQSFESSLPDIGEVLGYEDEYALMTADDEITVNVGIDGSDHDADVVIVAGLTDYNVETKSITTNVRYSFGELMKQAALNTLLGMGTTFVILIVLALIISLFQYIPKIQAMFEKKAETPAAAPAAAAVQSAAEAPVADDTELIAVIAAAIAASDGMTSTDGFVVRSVRKARKKF